MKYCPDVLITPSKLGPLAKEVNSTVVINPGTIVKGTSAGTFADITIHPIPKEQLEVAVREKKEEIVHNAIQRLAVEIVRI